MTNSHTTITQFGNVIAIETLALPIESLYQCRDWGYKPIHDPKLDVYARIWVDTPCLN